MRSTWYIKHGADEMISCMISVERMYNIGSETRELQLVGAVGAEWKMVFYLGNGSPQRAHLNDLSVLRLRGWSGRKDDDN
jgi:hypothetical protein